MSDSQGAGRNQHVFPDRRKPRADVQRTVANRPVTIAAARGPGKGQGAWRRSAQSLRRRGGARGLMAAVDLVAEFPQPAGAARWAEVMARFAARLGAGPTGGVGHFRRHQGPSGSPACALPGQLQQWAARC